MYLTDNDPTHTCNVSLLSVSPEETSAVAVEPTEGEQQIDNVVAGPPSTVESMRLVGHYRLKRCLGRGTTGSVWYAEDLEFIGRDVALKLMHADTHDEYMLARYNSEVRALARMDDPHIARIWEHGRTSDGKLYIAMELVPGVHLTKFCEAWSPSLHDRIKLIIQICRGMQHAHQRGILHRDLKPANILVTQFDGTIVPKIIDFGLAKSVTQPLLPGSPDTTQMGCLLGTIGYMSPEQASTGVRDVDTRSDVYSIAVMLYELLTNTLPIPREELNRVSLSHALDMIQNRDGDAASRRVARHPGATVHASRMHMTVDKLSQCLSGDLDAILEKGLRKEKELRYQSAGELADDLERYLRGAVVHARQRTWWYLTEKTLKRHWKLALTAGIIFLLFLASWVGMAFGFYHAVVARDQAEQAQSELEKAKNHEVILKEDAEKTIAFLEKILHSPNPVRLGQDVRLLDVLDSVYFTISDSFKQQPRAEAKVRVTLARSYLRLGNSQRALDLLEPVLQLPLQHVEGYRGLLLHAESLIVQAMTQQQRFTPAEARCIKLIETYQKNLTAETIPAVSSIFQTCSRIQMQQKRFAKAIHTLETAEKLLLPVRQQFVTEFWDIRGMLATHYAFWSKADQNQYETALSKLTGYLNDANELSPRDLKLTQILISKGTLLASHGKVTEAIALLEQLADQVEKETGPDRLQVNAMPMNGPDRLQVNAISINLAKLYLQAGQLRQARSAYRQTLEFQLKTYGKSNEITLSTLAALIRISQSMHLYFESAYYNTLFREGVALSSSLGDPRLQTARKTAVDVLSKAALQWFFLTARY